MAKMDGYFESITKVPYKEKTCAIEECGKTFLPLASTSLYCSKECSRKAKYLRIKQRTNEANKQKEKRKCLYPDCNNFFLPHHNNHKFCSATCKGKNKNYGQLLKDLPPRICRNIDCQKEFVPTNGNQLCCSKKCTNLRKYDPRRQAKKYPQGYFNEKQCKSCKQYFTPLSPSQIYCTSQCRGKTAYYQRVYGITEKEFISMKTKQNNKCAICDQEGFIMNGKQGHTEKLVVDHCHANGNVRGLLCHNCNRALGLFQDRIDYLESAIKYLGKD